MGERNNIKSIHLTLVKACILTAEFNNKIAVLKNLCQKLRFNHLRETIKSATLLHHHAQSRQFKNNSSVIAQIKQANSTCLVICCITFTTINFAHFQICTQTIFQTKANTFNSFHGKLHMRKLTQHTEQLWRQNLLSRFHFI